MALPNNDLFEHFFSATTVVAHDPDGPNIQIFDPKVSEASSVPALWIKYPESELKLHSVLRVVGRELELHGGVGDFETALTALALIVETREEGQPTVEHANDLLTRTRDARLYQSVIFPHPIADDYTAEFESVRFGSFSPAKLISLANRGTVQYPIDLDTLASRFCIEQIDLKVTITDFAHKDCHDLLVQNWSHSTAEVLIDNYFQAVNKHFFSQIRDSLREELCALEAGSLVSLDESLFTQPLLQTIVGMFTWKDERDRAWALLSHNNILHMNTPPITLVEECRSWLKSEFGFLGFSETKPFDQAARSFCRFLQKAQAYRLARKRDDAFLHFIIALDLLLGDEGRPSDSVCKRAGMLSYSQLEKNLDSHITSVRRLYNKRSKYVHEGISVEDQDLGEAEEICLEVLWVLLSALSIEDLDTVESWWNKVDYLVAATAAGRDLSCEDFGSVGIPLEVDMRKPPNHLVPNALSQRFLLNL